MRYYVASGRLYALETAPAGFAAYELVSGRTIYRISLADFVPAEILPAWNGVLVEGANQGESIPIVQFFGSTGGPGWQLRLSSQAEQPSPDATLMISVGPDVLVATESGKVHALVPS